MARHLLSASSAHQPTTQAGRHDVSVIFGAFVSDIYLPHAKLRKLSWDVDERIIRKYLSPKFGDRRFSGMMDKQNRDAPRRKSRSHACMDCQD